MNAYLQYANWNYLSDELVNYLESFLKNPNLQSRCNVRRSSACYMPIVSELNVSEYWFSRAYQDDRSGAGFTRGYLYHPPHTQIHMLDSWLPKVADITIPCL